MVYAAVLAALTGLLAFFANDAGVLDVKVAVPQSKAAKRSLNLELDADTLEDLINTYVTADKPGLVDYNRFLADLKPQQKEQVFSKTLDGEVPATPDSIPLEFLKMICRSSGLPDQAAITISQMDAAIGRLTDLLDKYGVADDTMIWYTHDNGPHTTRQQA